MIKGEFLTSFPRLIWYQPWLSPHPMHEWPLLLDIDRVPFTAWDRRIGE